MQLETSKITNRQQLLIDAVRKMDQGQRLFTEGKFEFDALTNGPGGGRDVTKKVETLVPTKPKAKKIVANKKVKRKKPKSHQAKRGEKIMATNNEKLTKPILQMVKTDEFATVHKLMKKMKKSFYPIRRVIDMLINSKQLKYVTKTNPTTHIPFKYLALV